MRRKNILNKSIVRVAAAVLSASMMLTPMAAYACPEFNPPQPPIQQDITTTDPVDEEPVEEAAPEYVAELDVPADVQKEVDDAAVELKKADSPVEKADALLDAAIAQLDVAESNIIVTEVKADETETEVLTDKVSKPVEKKLDSSENYTNKVDMQVQMLDFLQDEAEKAGKKFDKEAFEAAWSEWEANGAITGSEMATTFAKWGLAIDDYFVDQLADENESLAGNYTDYAAYTAAKETVGQNAADAAIIVQQAEKKVELAGYALAAASKEVFEANVEVAQANIAYNDAVAKVNIANWKLAEIKAKYGLNDEDLESFKGDAAKAIERANEALKLAEAELAAAEQAQVKAEEDQKAAVEAEEKAQFDVDASEYILAALQASENLTEFFNGSYQTEKIVDGQKRVKIHTMFGSYYAWVDNEVDNPEYQNKDVLYGYDIADVKALLAFQLYKDYRATDVEFTTDGEFITAKYTVDGEEVTKVFQYDFGTDGDNEFKEGEQDHWINVNNTEEVFAGYETVGTGEYTTNTVYTNNYGQPVNAWSYANYPAYRVKATKVGDSICEEYHVYYNMYSYWTIYKWTTKTEITTQEPVYSTVKAENSIVIEEDKFCNDYDGFTKEQAQADLTTATAAREEADQALVDANAKVAAAKERVAAVTAARDAVVNAMAALNDLEGSKVNLAQAQRQLAMVNGQLAQTNWRYLMAVGYYFSLYGDLQKVKDDADRTNVELTYTAPQQQNPQENNPEEGTPEEGTPEEEAPVVTPVNRVTPAGTPVLAAAPAVEIEEEAAPLAPEVEVVEEEAPKAPEVTVAEAPAEVVVEDQEVPLADKNGKRNWLWLLIVLVLVTGGAGAEYARRRKIKKAAAEAGNK